MLPSGKVGMFLFFIMLFPLTEFLFELMEKIANGEKITSDIKKILDFENKGMFLKMLLTFGFVSVLIVNINAILGTFIGYPIMAFFLLGLPASFIILMMEKSIFSMINPIKIGYIIKLFGGAYFLLYVIAIVAAVLSSQVNQIVNTSTNNLLAEFIFHAITIYLVIALFSMMGYLIFQYHHELNYSVRSSNLQSLKQSLKNDMTEVDIFLQEGRFEDAQKLLLNKINDNPMDYKANEKLILLYGIQGNNKHMDKIANAYFTQLIEDNNQSHAAEFYVRLSNQCMEFFPESTLVALSLADKMKNNQQYKVALSLLEHYSSKPGEGLCWDKVGLLKARFLAEYCNDNNAAIKLLDSILKRSVDQDLLTKAEKYRKVII